MPVLSAPWKSEAVSFGYSIHPQLQLQSITIKRLQPLTEVEGACTPTESDWDNRKVNKDKSALEETVKQMTSRAKDLSSADRENLQSHLLEFDGVISLRDGDLGCTGVVKHQINIGNATPIRQPARRLPFNQRGEVQNLVDRMLSRKIIEPAQ